MSEATPLKRVLILDDDGDFRRLIKVFLSKLLPDVEVAEYDPVAQGAPGDDFDWSPYDALILDYYLCIHNVTGLDILQAHRKNKFFPATIMMTGAGNEEIAVRALRAGVYDYLRKEKFDKEQLKQSLLTAVEKHQVERARVMEQTSHHRAFNKALFYQELEQGDDSGGERDRILLLVELDDHEVLEQRFGIIIRDNIVRHVARQCYEYFKDTSANPHITRLNDQSVALLITDPDPLEPLSLTMTGMCAHLQKNPYRFEDKKLRYTVSIGVVPVLSGSWRKIGHSADALLRTARDCSNVAAKHEGNSFYIYVPQEPAPPEEEFIPEPIPEPLAEPAPAPGLIPEPDAVAIPAPVPEPPLEIIPAPLHEPEITPARISIIDEAAAPTFPSTPAPAVAAERKTAKPGPASAPAKLPDQKSHATTLEPAPTPPPIPSSVTAKPAPVLQPAAPRPAAPAPAARTPPPTPAAKTPPPAPTGKERPVSPAPAMTPAPAAKPRSPAPAPTTRPAAKPFPPPVIRTGTTPAPAPAPRAEATPAPAAKTGTARQATPTPAATPAPRDELELDESKLAPQALKIKKAFNDDRVTQLFRPLISLTNEGQESEREVYRISLQVVDTDGRLTEEEEIYRTAAEPAFCKFIDRWLLRETIGRVVNHKPDKYLFLLRLSEASLADPGLFNWLRKLLAGLDNRQPGKSIALEVAAVNFVELEKPAAALMTYLHKSHGFRFVLGQVNSTSDVQAAAGQGSQFDMVLMHGNLLKELKGGTQQPTQGALLSKLSAQGQRIVVDDIQDATSLTDAIALGADLAMGRFVGEPIQQLEETGSVESLEIV